MQLSQIASGGMLGHGIVKYIAEYKNTNDLIRGIEYIFALNSGEIEEMRDNAVKKVRNNFTLDMMVDNYINLYKRILKI